jgi:hypothetical protein
MADAAKEKTNGALLGCMRCTWFFSALYYYSMSGSHRCYLDARHFACAAQYPFPKVQDRRTFIVLRSPQIDAHREDVLWSNPGIYG